MHIPSYFQLYTLWLQIVLYLGNSTHLWKCECTHHFQNLLSIIFGLFGTFHINCKEHMKVRSSYFLHNFCLFDHTTGHRGQHFFCSYPCTFPTLATIHSMDTLFYHHRIFFYLLYFFLLCVVMIITYAKWFKKWRIINYNELKRIHLESLLILIRIISWLLRKLKSIFIFHFLGDNSSNEKEIMFG